MRLGFIYQYRELIGTLVVRDLRVRYRRSILGFVWTMLQPLMTLVVLTVVFSALFRFDILNYPVYAVAGILFWNFFSQSIIASMNSLKSSAPLLQKLPLPMELFPLATVLSGIVNFVFAWIPMLIIMLATGHPIRPALLFVPVATLIAAVFTYGIGLILSPLAVFFTDVVELVGVILTMLMYMTPIFYPLSIVPARFMWVIRYNPVRSVLEVFRDPIYYGKLPPLSHLSLSVVIAIAALALGMLVFRKTSSQIPFYV